MPAISVIVPVYKVEAYLRRCVDSILGQSFSDFDLILVDDGSPDRCGEICGEYAARDSRVTVLHRENGGLSAARNTGIDYAMAHSDSKWLAFVDSDDWVAPEYLEYLFRAAEETGCRLAVCGFQYTGGESLPAAPMAEPTVLEAMEYYCSETVHGGTTATAWNKLYHKDLFASLRYPEGKLHEDEFTTYRAVYQAGNIAVIDAELYAYYQNDAGITRSCWSPRRMDALEAVEGQIAFARERGEKTLERKAVEQYVYSILSQMEQVEALPERRRYLPILRRKLRRGLKWARPWSLFRREKGFTWVYERAYPCKPLWWLLEKSRKKGG